MAQLTVQQLHDKTVAAQDGLVDDAKAMKALDAEYAERSTGIEGSKAAHEKELEGGEAALTRLAPTLTGVVTDIVDKDGGKVALIPDGSTKRFHFARQLPPDTPVDVPDDEPATATGDTAAPADADKPSDKPSADPLGVLGEVPAGDAPLIDPKSLPPVPGEVPPAA